MQNTCLDMTVLITGGCGAVGSRTAKRFLDEGEKVVLYDVTPIGGRPLESLRPYLKNVNVVKGDILNLDQLEETMKEFAIDGVIHTAGILGDPPCREAPLRCIRVNVEGSANVFEAARLAKLKRVVYTSSRGVYTREATDRPLQEEFPIKQTLGSMYGLSKAVADMIGLEYSNSFALDLITCRLATVYGPGQQFQNYLSPMLMVESAIDGRPYRLPSGRDHMYELIYVDDVAEALFLCYKIQAPQYRVFNIGSGRLTRLSELADLTRKLVPDAIIELGPGPLGGMGGGGTPLDVTRAEKVLGFKPRYDLERGLKELVDWIKQKKAT